jgi:hypothetical protein
MTTTTPRRCRAAALAVAAALLASPHFASAYVAAGDRNFPAMILLPQLAPADQLYTTPMIQPVSGGRSTDVGLTFAKTLTERLGMRFEEEYTWLGRNGASTLTGWQNLDMTTQYLAILDPEHEAFGHARRQSQVGRHRHTTGRGFAERATAPTVYFGKGMGDLDLGYLRPFAITGSVGYQFADAPPRLDNLLTGIAVEYSIPYLQSKVQSFDLPDILRGMTPLVETFVTTATRNRGDNRTSVVFGPGINYSGEGWEFIIEALVPAGRGASNGLGIAAQFNLSLDYFFPDTIGKPLFSRQ